MLLIPCPHCGDRDEVEFRYGGECQPAPTVPLDDATPVEAWGEHLFLRTNAAGVIEEKWFHFFGCRQWVRLRRDTRTDDFMPQAGAPS